MGSAVQKNLKNLKSSTRHKEILFEGKNEWRSLTHYVGGVRLTSKNFLFFVIRKNKVKGR
jgi:hypothetical protein